MSQHVDPILVEAHEFYQREERLGLVEKAVSDKVNEMKHENGQ